jgi:hypothetical protein
MWIAEFSESSNLWTHIALFGIPKSMLVWVSVNTSKLFILKVLDLSKSNAFFTIGGGLLEMQVQLDTLLSYKHIYLVPSNGLLLLLQLT